MLRRPRTWNNIQDLDVIVEDLDKVKDVLASQGFVQTDETEDHAWFVRYEHAHRQWVHIDVNKQIRFADCAAPTSFVTELISDRVEDAECGLPVIAPVHESAILIYHCAVHKGRFASEYLERIGAVGSDRLESVKDQFNFVRGDYQEHVQTVSQMIDGSISASQAARSIRSNFHVKALWLRRLNARLMKVVRGPAAWFRPRCVAFIGPDGVGKSCITEAMAALPHPPMRRQYMGVNHPEEMGLFIRWTWRAMNCIQKKTSYSSFAGKIIRASLDFVRWLDFFTRIRRHVSFSAGRKGLLVLDRYPCDAIFQRPPRWRRWSERLFLRRFYKPTFSIFLMGDPDAIHARKADRTPEVLAEMIAGYRELLKKYAMPHTEVNTTSNGIEECVRLSLTHIISTFGGPQAHTASDGDDS
jgi:hypothetical protein